MAFAQNTDHLSHYSHSAKAPASASSVKLYKTDTPNAPKVMASSISSGQKLKNFSSNKTLLLASFKH